MTPGLIWAWLSGSRAGRMAGMLGAAALALLLAWGRGRRSGKRAARDPADPRDADQRLRDAGRLRD